MGLSGDSFHILNLKIQIAIQDQLISCLFYRFTSQDPQVVISIKDVEVAILIYICKGRGAGEKSIPIGNFFYSNFPFYWDRVYNNKIAFVESCQKNNPEVLVIVFYFLHEGAHVKTDINNDLKPALEKSNLKMVCITKHLGTDEKMIDLIIERAKEVEDAN